MLTNAAAILAHLAAGCWWIALLVVGAWIFALGLGKAAARPYPEQPKSGGAS